MLKKQVTGTYPKPIQILQRLQPRQVGVLHRMVVPGPKGGRSELQLMLDRLRKYDRYNYHHPDLTTARLPHTFADLLPNRNNWLKYCLRELQELIEDFLIKQYLIENPALHSYMVMSKYRHMQMAQLFKEGSEELMKILKRTPFDVTTPYLSYQLQMMLEEVPPKKSRDKSIKELPPHQPYAQAQRALDAFFLTHRLHLGIEQLNRHTNFGQPHADEELQYVLANPAYAPLLQQPAFAQLLALYRFYQPHPTPALLAETLEQIWPLFQPLDKLNDPVVANYLMNGLIKAQNNHVEGAARKYLQVVKARVEMGHFDQPGSLPAKRYRVMIQTALDLGEIEWARSMNERLLPAVNDGRTAWYLNCAYLYFCEGTPGVCLGWLKDLHTTLPPAEHLFVMRLTIKAAYTLMQKQPSGSEQWRHYENMVRKTLGHLPVYLKRHRQHLAAQVVVAYEQFAQAMQQLLAGTPTATLLRQLAAQPHLAERMWLQKVLEGKGGKL